LALLASGFSPIYPCHVPPRDMRSHPIGTGPFKFVEFKPNEYIKLTRNLDYWKKGRPYLDGIEYTIIRYLSTAVMGFVAAASKDPPRSFAWIMSNRSGGRGRLPTCSSESVPCSAS
jgi:ABC-type transport system substrate-binding protein